MRLRTLALALVLTFGATGMVQASPSKQTVDKTKRPKAKKFKPAKSPKFKPSKSPKFKQSKASKVKPRKAKKVKPTHRG